MRVIRSCFICVTALFLLGTVADARSRHKARGPSQPGVFDYYVLSLSWSPQHCSEANDQSDQCSGSRPFGFVVHGLWPQFNKGYPEACPGAPFDPDQVPAHLLDVMPSDQLIRHEWQTHGTCSGLEESAYFGQVLNAWQSLHIPNQYQQPLKQVHVTPAKVRHAFSRANSGADISSFAVIDNGRFLREVRVCMNKDLALRACTDLGDTQDDRVLIMRPVR